MALCVCVTLIPAGAASGAVDAFWRDWEPASAFGWSFDNGTLTLYGPGDMKYDYMDSPWSAYENRIRHLVVDKDVTSICEGAFFSYDTLTDIIFKGDRIAIEKEAFFWCDALTSVTFSGDVGSIGEEAFMWCDALTSVTFSGDVGSIGGSAFMWCDALTSVTFSGDVGSIGGGAFYDCDALAAFTIPASVTYIGDDAFWGCDNLTDIYYGGSKAQWKKIVADTSDFRYITVHFGDETPDNPEPDTPDNPEPKPDKPDIPDNPEPEPDTPDNPEPDTPDNPEPKPDEPDPVSGVPGLPELTYKFSNSQTELGYSYSYRIPYERYKMIFGDNSLAQWYYQSSGNWGGSCYGFASTAGMFSQSGNGVSTDTFQSGASLPSQLQTSDKNTQWNITVRDFLESMQVSQMAQRIQNDYQNNQNKLNELCAAVDAYQRTGTNPVLVAVFGREGGHALLAYKLEQNKLFVYDCNYPNTERHITLTTDASGNYTGWYYHLNDAYDWGSAYKGSWISFVPYADFYDIWANRSQKQATNMELLTVNANVMLRDLDGVPIASLEDGELITAQPDIYPFVEIGLTADGETPERDTMSVWIPVGVYDLEKKDDYVRVNGEVVLMSADTPFEASVTHVDQSANVTTTADGFSFVVDDQYELNQVMFDETAAAGTYDITFQSTLGGTRRDARITGNLMAQLMTFGMVEGKAAADPASLVSIESYFLNGQQVNTASVSNETKTVVSFSANGGEGSMSPRTVADDGQFTLPVCEFTAPSTDGTFIGWLVNGTVYQPGQTVTLTADTVAVAQWSGLTVSDITVKQNAVTVKFSGEVSKAMSVSVCAYSKDGKMLACAAQTVNSGTSATLSLTTAGADYVKAFLLDANDSAPLCNPVRKNLS